MKAELKLLEGCSQGSSELGGEFIDDEDLQALLKGEIPLQQIKKG